MKIKISILVLMIFGLGLVLALTAAEEARFNLHSDTIFRPGEIPSIRLSSQNLEQLEFRIYRVDDPVAFFQSQPNVHQIKDPDPAITGETVREKVAAKKDSGISWLRRLARQTISVEKRQWLIEKLPWLRSPEQPKQTVHLVHDPYAPLNEKNLVETWTQAVQRQEKKYDWQWDYTDVELKVNNPGVYLVEGLNIAQNRKAYTMVIVTDLTFVNKSTDSQILVWAVNRNTGEAIANATVTAMVKQEITARGATDASGIFSYQRGDFTDESGTNVVLMVQDGPHFAISDPYYYASSWAAKSVYVYTDRPVYRPGQTVYFKGVLREKGKEDYAILANQDVDIEIRDSRYNEAGKLSLKTSDQGTFHGEYLLADEPPLGRYEMVVSVGDNSYWFDFKVEEYKKPEYEVNVRVDQPTYINGETIEAAVEARYYFGEPVQNADVEYFIYRTDYWLPWWFWYDDVYSWYFEDDEYDYGYYGQEMLYNGSGKLNSDGTFHISYKTDTELAQDSRYLIEARVVDAARREITGSHAVVVSRGEYFIRLLTDKWVYEPNGAITVKLKTFDFQKNGRNALLNLTVERRIYEDHTERFEPVTSGAETTSAGEGFFVFTPAAAGYYRITAAGSDQYGNTVDYTHWIYVSDRYSDYAWGMDGLQIIPDRNQYQLGETAHVMIISPVENVSVLITVEGADLYQHTVNKLNGNATLIDVPITKPMQPNCFVNASLIVNNSYYSESKPIVSPPTGQFLNVSIESDQEVYRPGEEAVFTITTTDETAQPVSAEISVGVVDEAVYAIAPEITEDIQRFFYGKRWNSVSTLTSLYFNFYGYSSKIQAEEPAETGLGAMKARNDFVDAEIRKDFKDTAYWTPAVRTDAGGKATVTFTMPDNLTTWRTTVRAVSPTTQVGSRVIKTITRKDLLVRLETPRFMTQDDKIAIGTTVHNYLDSEKVTRVSLETSPAVSLMGSYELREKYSAVDSLVEISPSEVEVRIPARGEVALEWDVYATQVGEAKLIAQALTDEESDAMELKLPILPRGLPEYLADSGEIVDDPGDIDLSLVIPATAIAGTPKLTLNLSPSLAAGAFASLDYLIGYPYGCVEQTMSRFLPTVVVSKTLRDLNLGQPEWTTEIPQMVQKGLDRLYNYQHDDGGWGWWENDATNAYNTAYVMYGLHIAREAGFEVDDWRFNRGVQALDNLLRQTKLVSETHYGTYGERTTRAYLAYVYSFVQPDRGKVFDAYFQRSNVQLTEFITDTQPLERMNYVNALNAMTLASLGATREAEYLLTDLSARIDPAAALVSWGEDSGYSWYNNTIETTATALQAFVKIDPQNPIIPKVIRYLYYQKQGDRWRSTRDTAHIVYALAEYLGQTRELSANYDLEIFVNEEKVKQMRITPELVMAGGTDIILTDLPVGQNQLQIRKRGGGTAYYSYRLNYFNAGSIREPQANGLRIERTYYLLEQTTHSGKIAYHKRPFTGNAAFGDRIYVVLEISSDTDYEYVMVEDPLPAGCEAIKDDEYMTILDEKRPHTDDYWGWPWWYADRDIRDEKVSFFITELTPGSSQMNYVLRAEKPGEFNVSPPRAELMYFPEVNGHGVEQSFNIYDIK